MYQYCFVAVWRTISVTTILVGIWGVFFGRTSQRERTLRPPFKHVCHWVAGHGNSSTSPTCFGDWTTYSSNRWSRCICSLSEGVSNSASKISNWQDLQTLKKQLQDIIDGKSDTCEIKRWTIFHDHVDAKFHHPSKQLKASPMMPISSLVPDMKLQDIH